MMITMKLGIYLYAYIMTMFSATSLHVRPIFSWHIENKYFGTNKLETTTGLGYSQ
jgi:hypothetical protein